MGPRPSACATYRSSKSHDYADMGVGFARLGLVLDLRSVNGILFEGFLFFKIGVRITFRGIFACGLRDGCCSGMFGRIAGMMAVMSRLQIFHRKRAVEREKYVMMNACMIH